MTALNSGYNDYLAALIAGAQSGDTEMITELISVTYPKVQKYAAAMLASSGNSFVDDVAQETMLKIVKNINTVRNPEGFNSWVRTTANNTAKDFLKTAPVRNDIIFSNLESDDGEMSYDPGDERITSRPDQILDQQTTQKIILDVMDTLPAEQREVVMKILRLEQILTAISARSFTGRKRKALPSIMRIRLLRISPALNRSAMRAGKN